MRPLTSARDCTYLVPKVTHGCQIANYLVKTALLIIFSISNDLDEPPESVKLLSSSHRRPFATSPPSCALSAGWIVPAPPLDTTIRCFLARDSHQLCAPVTIPATSHPSLRAGGERREQCAISAAPSDVIRGHRRRPRAAERRPSGLLARPNSASVRYSGVITWTKSAAHRTCVIQART